MPAPSVAWASLPSLQASTRSGPLGTVANYFVSSPGGPEPDHKDMPIFSHQEIDLPAFEYWRQYRKDSHGSEPTVNLLGGWTAGVWEGSEHVDVAAKFLAYIVSADADLQWVQEAGQAPLRASTAEAVDLPEWLQTVVTGVSIGYAPPAEMKGDWRPVFNAIMQDVLVNGTDAEAALSAGIDTYMNG